MQLPTYFNIILLTCIIALLSACASIDKISSKEGATEVLLLNLRGELVVIDKESARKVPECNQSNRKGFMECKIPFNLNKFKENPEELKRALENACKQKSCDGIVLEVSSILSIKHKGSHCRLIYDRATGETFQICRPGGH